MNFITLPKNNKLLTIYCKFSLIKLIYLRIKKNYKNLQSTTFLFVSLLKIYLPTLLKNVII